MKNYCINCGVKLTAVDEDPNGDKNCVCAKCRAEEKHDFDAEPNVQYDRAGRCMTFPPEPVITVNGVTLNIGQAMTVRVALQSFATDVYNNGLGDDEMGKTMSKNYLRLVSEINKLIALN